MFFGVLVLSQAGCAKKLSEIVFVVDTDLPRPLTDFRLLFREPATLTPMLTPAAQLGDPPWTLSVRDAGSGDRPIVFVAYAMTSSGEQVYYRGRTQFLPGRRKVVQIFLSETCFGFTLEQDQMCDPVQNRRCCATGTSCRMGACENEFIDPNTLPDFTPELAESRLDAGFVREARVDAQRSDTAVDVSVDVANESGADVARDSVASDADSNLSDVAPDNG